MNAIEARKLAVRQVVRSPFVESAAVRGRRSVWYRRITLPLAKRRVRAAVERGHTKVAFRRPRGPGGYGRREALFADLRELGFEVYYLMSGLWTVWW